MPLKKHYPAPRTNLNRTLASLFTEHSNKAEENWTRLPGPCLTRRNQFKTMNIPFLPPPSTAVPFLGSGSEPGSAALNMLMANNSTKPRYLLPKARAKRVIFLCMAGGPSHLETFDYKPKLDQLHGQPMPESFTKGSPSHNCRAKNSKCRASNQV